MAWELGDVLRMREYKGYAIRAASYQVRPGDWAPEARFSHHTDRGWRQLWVQSFEHLFASPRQTFATQTEADHYAFCMAQSVIDKIQCDLAGSGRNRFALARLFRRLHKNNARPLMRWD